MAKKAAKPLDYNYAKEEDFAQQVMSDLLNIWEILKSERDEREDVWQESYRAWSVNRTDADKAYEGRANLNLPQLRKETETMTRRVYKGLFPDDYLKAVGTRLDEDDLALGATQIVRHYYDNIMNIKSFAMPWIKQGVIYGTSPARQFWRRDVNEMFFKKRYFVENKEGILEPKTKIVQEEVTTYNAPELRAEDLFQTWVYPHNADKPENIKKVFWRTKVDKECLRKKEEEGTFYGYEQIKDMGAQREWDFEESVERLQQFGQSGLFAETKDSGMFDLLEVWLDLVLPGQDKPVPCVVEIINEGHVGRIQRNPYWHQRPPFDFMRFILPPPGEFYGRGLPEASNSIQHQIDDILNQTMDATTLALNNITIINPAYAPNADSFEVEPGAVWWADPNAVKQFQFPDLSNTGIKNVGMLRSMISELSDNSPQLPDPIAGKARSTGQAQLAVNEWQTDLYTILDLISAEAMQPMAQKTHILLQQNLDDDTMIRVAGKYAGSYMERILTPEDFAGRFNFQWSGSLQIESQSIKVQQMLNFLRVYSSIPPEAKINLNWENFVIKLMRDGFLIKDVHNIVETERLKASVSPYMEHKLLDAGAAIKVHKSDDDDAHIRNHRAYMLDTKDKYKRSLMQKHIQEHESQIEAKQQEMALMQMQMQQMALAQGKGGGRPPGNPGMIPEATDQSNLERGMRVEQ